MLALMVCMASMLDDGLPHDTLLQIVIMFVVGLRSSSWSPCWPNLDTWEDCFSIFKGTCVAKNVLYLDRGFPISFVPEVSDGNSLCSSKFKKLKQCPSLIWRRKMSAKDWPLALEILVNPCT
jgi:hypothetical protein